MKDATAESALEAFRAKFNQVVEALRKTFTYGQGKAMSCHKELAERAKVQVYFCDPHSAWQRGSRENTNGLLRQFSAIGTDLSVQDQEALDSIADLINHRPRMRLDWRSPYEAFIQFTKAIEQQKTATVH